MINTRFAAVAFAMTSVISAGCSNDPRDIKPVEVTRENFLFAADFVYAAKSEFRTGIDAIRKISDSEIFIFPVSITTLTLDVEGVDNPINAIGLAVPINSTVLTVNGTRDLKKAQKRRWSLRLRFMKLTNHHVNTPKRIRLNPKK